jgi:uncharacterized lipoprotein YajG
MQRTFLSGVAQMSRLDRVSWTKLSVAVLAASLLLAGCAPVGSARWCANMKAKPKGDWTANEAVDFAKHCVLPDNDTKKPQ